MVSIPGTSYQITGSQIQTADGQPVSQEEFVQKVKGGEVSLSANSLQVIESHLGPDLSASLTAASQAPGAAGRVLTKLGAGEDEGVGGKGGEKSFDITSLMLLMAKSAETMRQTQSKIRDAQFQQQLGELNKQKDDAFDGAYWKMVAGCVAGAVSIASAGAQAAGVAKAAGQASKAVEASEKAAAALGAGDEALSKSFEATSKGFSNAADQILKKWSAGAEAGGAGGKISEALIGQFAGADKERDAAAAGVSAKEAEAEVARTRDMLDSIREMDQKVREALQAVNNADSEASKAVARM
jgi:hypothetical protein